MIADAARRAATDRVNRNARPHRGAASSPRPNTICGAAKPGRVKRQALLLLGVSMIEFYVDLAREPAWGANG